MSRVSKIAFPALLMLAAGSGATVFAAEISSEAQNLDRYGIRTTPAQEAHQATLSVLPGVIMPPRNTRIGITAPFAGTVETITALPGLQVKKGEKLATLLSREVIETASQLRQAESELEALQAVAHRYRTLADKKIAAENRAEEAEAQVRRALAVVEEHRRLLSVGTIALEDQGRYALKAPADGRIVDVGIEIGESVEAMKPVLKIDTSNRLWVEVQLPLSLVGKVEPGDTLKVGEEMGKVLAISREVNPKTRSVTMLGELAEGAPFVSGQLVTVKIVKPVATGAIEIPARALAYVDGEPSVFVKTGTGFARKPVTVHGQAVETVSVSGDLEAGAQVATSGLVVLENMTVAE